MFATVAAAIAGPFAARVFSRQVKWAIVVQALAMAGGLFAVFLARPAYLVFTLDRFDLVPANEISARDLADTRDERFRRRPLDGPAYVAAVLPRDERERQRILESSFEGKDLQRFPQYYVAYLGEAAAALKRAKPLAAVHAKAPEAIERELARLGRLPDSVRVLPLRAKKKDGLVLLDASSGVPLSILLVDPW